MPNKGYEWVNTEVMQRLRTRYLLQAYPVDPDALAILRTIQPVTNLDELLKDSKQERSAPVSITANGLFTFFTVPQGKRWTIRAIYLYLSTGTYQFNEIAMLDTIFNFPIYLFSAAASVLYWVPAPFKIDERIALRGQVANWAVIGNAYMEIFRDEEDVYPST